MPTTAVAELLLQRHPKLHHAVLSVEYLLLVMLHSAAGWRVP
jgi:hypothetical protein